jgi:hypothetical protein
MKKSLFLALTLAAMVALIYACSKNSNKTESVSLDKTTHLISVAKRANGSSGVTVSCVTNCDSGGGCRIEGQMGGGGEQFMQCSCSGCKMNVREVAIVGVDTTVRNTVLVGAKIPVYFLESFQGHMKTTYPGQDYNVSEVSIMEDQQNNLDNYVITYSYVLASGLKSTVMFTWARLSGTTQKVDCKGTCDCRERYFPGTGAIECTCAGDCNMTITKLGIATRDNPPK